MKRRDFLKSAFALGLAPAVSPLVPGMLQGAAAATNAGPVASTVPIHIHQWAEIIVRARGSCDLAFLQSHLRANMTTVRTIHAELVRNGVISANANASGVYHALNPVGDGRFPSHATTIETPQPVQSAPSEERSENVVIAIDRLYRRGQYEQASGMLVAA